MIDETHDPKRRSWVPTANSHSDFPIQNLPFGVFSPTGDSPRIGCAIGSFILDLAAASHGRLLPEDFGGVLGEQTLNSLLALPAAERRHLRGAIFELLSDSSKEASVGPFLHASDQCQLHLPARIGDYTDFYVGIHHAQNVGRLFRPDSPLLPNYKHMPIGYHGRASSVQQSGIPVRRPSGQIKFPDNDNPIFGPTRRLDYELELGIWIGAGNALGVPIAVGEALDHVAGLTLLNDWSARDFQVWEYQPLGPFLAKNFHSTISPWIVTAEALAPFHIAQGSRSSDDPTPLPYLWDQRDQDRGAFSIELAVEISTAAMRDRGLRPFRLSTGPASNMYWTVAQMIAHHTSGGCNLASGDLLGSGTISAPETGGFGSLLEITRGGAEPIKLPSGEERPFLLDGDEINLRGQAHIAGFVSIGFGSCRAEILPAA